jgi:hypothetical protein
MAIFSEIRLVNIIKIQYVLCKVGTDGYST